MFDLLSLSLSVSLSLSLSLSLSVSLCLSLSLSACACACVCVHAHVSPNIDRLYFESELSCVGVTLGRVELTVVNVDIAI